MNSGFDGEDSALRLPLQPQAVSTSGSKQPQDVDVD
jgi:hypothetical protein